MKYSSVLISTLGRVFIFFQVAMLPVMVAQDRVQRTATRALLDFIPWAVSVEVRELF